MVCVWGRTYNVKVIERYAVNRKGKPYLFYGYILNF